MSTPLPVIVGLGGINAAGRISFDHAYRRMVIDALPEAAQQSTLRSLGALMGIDDAQAQRAHILDHTLIRRVEAWDTESVLWQSRFAAQGTNGDHLRFTTSKRQLPTRLPSGWQVEAGDGDTVTVTVSGDAEFLLADARPAKVTSAGQIPSGFDPGALYQSRNHPRALQLTVFAASDALRSTGFSLDALKAQIAPDQFAVYASSAMGQLDNEGYGGLFRNSLMGRRPTAKNVPLGLAEMPADFVNAYVLGGTGGAAGIVGACASFLYNLKQGMEDIRSGSKRLVLVGNAEAPVIPEVMEGYRTMGALAEDEALAALDGTDTVDNRRACRPFSDNCGFTVAEASVFAVLMDDALALELGARVLGSVADVFVNADGFKKSIPGPGIGNYLTVAKAMASARDLLGDKALKAHTHIQAHGTGTPQNRVTESHILNSLAATFGIERWPVAAIKAYVGHSMAPAAGDQLSAVVGLWRDGILPGIATIDHIADDVSHDHLLLPLQHQSFDATTQQAAFINSKGFGGNNATGLILAPEQTRHMLRKRWGERAMTDYAHRHEAIDAAAQAYDAAMCEQTLESIYQFGEGVLEGEDLTIEADSVRVPGYALPVTLESLSLYRDMHDAEDPSA